MKVQMTGIAWYSEKDYYSLRDKFLDKEKLPEGYLEWLQSANSLFNKLETENINVVKVFLEPKKFVDWCIQNKMEMDSKARVRYANEGASNAVRNEKSRT